jgi:hypothetical protein
MREGLKSALMALEGVRGRFSASIFYELWRYDGCPRPTSSVALHC